jgi:hypothetical protein
MARLSETFVADEAEDLSFEPLPPGVYVAQVKKTDLKVTKAGDGEYIALQWEILEADDDRYVGRVVFQNLNIVNPSEMATKIGRSQLKQITKAMGIDNLTDTDELLGTPVKITLKIRKGKDGYDDSNDVAKVMPLSEVTSDVSDDSPF